MGMDFISDVRFAVGPSVAQTWPRPIIAVDGSVQGADVCFDHHASGEAVNLLAIPATVPRPGTLVTTMLDGDAVISAAVVLLRAAGQEAPIRAAWPVLHEASYYCDWLGASGEYVDAEAAGLGLHCWLKEHGFALGEILAWGARELRADEAGHMRPTPSRATQSLVFGHLTRAVVTGVAMGALPRDLRYLDRLPAMERDAQRAIVRVDGQVTVLAPTAYLDPVAYYRVVKTDLVVVTGPAPAGRWRYSIGVHPRAYARIDLGPLLDALARQEPGWGGRRNAGGAPRVGSLLSLDDLVTRLNAVVS
jgi:hypothetical protein